MHAQIVHDSFSRLFLAYHSRVKKHEGGSSFFLLGGGRREGVSEEVKTLGEALPPLNY